MAGCPPTLAGSAVFRAWPPRITFTIWHRGLGDDPATWNWISWVGFEMKLLVQNWPSPVFLSQYPHMDMSQSPWKPMRWTSAKVAKPEKWLDQYILFWQWFPAIFLTHQPRNHYTLKVETLRWPGRISGRIRSEWTKTKKYAGWWFGTLEKWGY